MFYKMNTGENRIKIADTYFQKEFCVDISRKKLNS